MGCNGNRVVFSKVDLMDRFLQGCKVLRDGLIHEVISVCKVQNLLLQSRLQQAVHDLKSRVGLACAGCHDQQDAILTLSNGFHSTVNCVSLIITGSVGCLTGIVGLVDSLDFSRSQALFCLISGKQFIGCWELIEIDLPLLPCETVMLIKSIAVAAIRKWYI